VSDVKVALVDLHIPVEGAGTVVVHAGDVIPSEVADSVKNEAAYRIVDAKKGAADAEAAQKAAADAAEKAKADAAAAEEAAKLAAQGKELAGGAPAGESETPAYDPSTEPEHGTAYVDRAYASVQAAAKARGLNAAGTADTIIARLEADDRERAENE
jgi:colicin import membrane protein